MTSNISLSFGSKTDSGIVKEFNTDAILEFPILKGHVFIVCDGHSGDQGHGALASKLTVENIKKYFYNQNYKDLQKALTNAISYANYSVFEQSKKDSKYSGIGSTVAILIYKEGKLFYAYAGDSRIYKMAKGNLVALTRDHVDDLNNTETANVEVLVGKQKDIKFGVCKNPLIVEESDQFLICTDGLTDQLTDDEITEVLLDENTSPDHKVMQLVDSANSKGGKDNVSVHVLSFNKDVIESTKTRKPISKKLLIYSLIFVVIAALGFGAYSYKDVLLNNKKEDKIITSKEINQTLQAFDTVDEIIEKKDLIEVEKTKVVKEEVPQNNKQVQPERPTYSQVYHKHHVKYGDNLYRLGIRYNVSQQIIIEKNNNKAKNLIAGSFIEIPVLAVYTVKSGDSYSVVSDKFNVKIDLICKANKISKNTPLKEGQVLVIPNP